ncbi:MAG: peptidase S10 [Candidatus Eremiobacteraeota bacterium]|nr:peptidase S10 [Candidatus Eremiobacteraeota bacterium]
MNGRLSGGVLAAVIAMGASPASVSGSSDAVSHATAYLGGRSIPYTARAGTITLRDETGRSTASMFYTAFTRDGVASLDRPITFFYNGGPGSSSIWLRMGSFAPLRVQSANDKPIPNPPFSLIENRYSLIDTTDLVFVDPPNTGFSRLARSAHPMEFMGVDQDAAAFSQFIHRFLTEQGRWNSPKFLFGESYGTTRTCVLVNLLQQEGVQINGVVLLSPALNWAINLINDDERIGGGDWTFVTYLPTEAATAWYHRKAGTGQTLSAFLNGVEAYAGGQYLHDLAEGSDLDAAQFSSDVAKLHAYLGLPEDYIRRSNLRIPYTRFLQGLLRSQGRMLGRHDARYTSWDLTPVEDDPDWDPTDVSIFGAFVALNMDYLTRTLGYHTSLQYRPIADATQLGAAWDFRHNGVDPPVNAAPDLANAMATNPHLLVFTGMGYYDHATPFFANVYAFNHLGLVPQLRRNLTFGFYPSGHMLYLNPDALAAFRSDLGRWYARALSR